VHAPPSHIPLAHCTAVPQVPVTEQVSTPLLEHWVEPGAHTPVHAPETQAWLTQGTGVPQLAVASHVCAPLPEHCVAPGTHTHEPQ
jgi:hypothetical protein